MLKNALLCAALLAGCARHATGPLIYLSDEESGNVVIIDPTQAAVIATVPVGKRPRGLKLSRDGKVLYVALSGSPRGGPGVDESKLPPPDRSADGIGVVDVATRKLVRTIESGQDPETFDLSPDGKTLYVSNEETSEMTAIDLVANKIIGRAKVGNEPEGVTVSPNGKSVWVTSEADGKVFAVDAQTLAPLGNVTTGPRPRSIIFTQDGSIAFATNENAHTLTVVDTVAYKDVGTVPVKLASKRPMGARPMGGILSKDGKTLYVSTGRGGSVAIIDVATRTQVRSIDGVGDRPWGIALSADGNMLYTANGTSHDMSMTNLVTGNVDHRVHIGGLPWGVAVSQP